MKKELTKVNRAIVEAYNEMYQNLDFLKVSAQELARGDFKNCRELADIITDINYYYHQYKASQSIIDVLESLEQEASHED